MENIFNAAKINIKYAMYSIRMLKPLECDVTSDLPIFCCIFGLLTYGRVSVCEMYVEI